MNNAHFVGNGWWIDGIETVALPRAREEGKWHFWADHINLFLFCIKRLAKKNDFHNVLLIFSSFPGARFKVKISAFARLEKI